MPVPWIKKRGVTEGAEERHVTRAKARSPKGYRAFGARARASPVFRTVAAGYDIPLFSP